jgi:uncharacterized protein (TIGR00730 family)
MRVCIFAGSSPGSNPNYLRQAQNLGALLARRKIGLVYGGASVGLMGAAADAALGAGGEVIGVIPRSLVARELAHKKLPDLRIVNSMHERKATMAQLSDGFIAIPGGIGTLEEIFEIWTWAQLGEHEKPCALLNTDNYYAPLLSFLDKVVGEGFLKPVHREMLLVDSDPERLLDRMNGYVPPIVIKWIGGSER